FAALDSIRTNEEHIPLPSKPKRETRHVRIIVPVRQQPLRAGLRSGDRDVRRQSAFDDQGADHGERISGNRTGGIAGGDRGRLRTIPVSPREQQCRLTDRAGAIKMADVTYYVALPFLQDDDGSPV